MKIGKLKLGQMLMEVLIAFTVASIALIAILQLSNRTVNTSGQSNRASQASNYINEAAGWLQSQREGMSWIAFSSKTGGWPCFFGGMIYCLDSFPPNFLDYTGGSSCTANQTIPGTVFTRSIWMCTDWRANGPKTMEVQIADLSVWWNEGNVQRVVNREIEFFQK